MRVVGGHGEPPEWGRPCEWVIATGPAALLWVHGQSLRLQTIFTANSHTKPPQALQSALSKAGGGGGLARIQIALGEQPFTLSGVARKWGLPNGTQQQQPGSPPTLNSGALPGAAPFQPDGYHLPSECAKHSVLFTNIFDELRPWMVRGISREDMDACAPVAPAGHNTSAG